jgi:hypothetical protein
MTACASPDTTIGAAIVPKVPRGLRVLQGSSKSDIPTVPVQPSAESERRQLEQDASAIETWWKSDPRWMHTRRIYSGT